MNGSAANVSVVVQYRDSFTKAVIKNVIILVIGIFINGINSSLIHTFWRHQVSGAPQSNTLTRIRLSSGFFCLGCVGETKTE